MDSVWLIAAGLFSIVGMAAFVYGRRQRLLVPTLVGLALMIYPYFVGSTLGVVGVGAILLGALVLGTRAESGI